MRAAQRGDQAAYTRLVRKVMPLLQRVLRTRQRFLQSADRDDLMQEVLLSLHRAMATYDPGREFVPWLMAIARNKMADHARRFARSSANEVLVEDLGEIGAARAPRVRDGAMRRPGGAEGSHRSPFRPPAKGD